MKIEIVHLSSDFELEELNNLVEQSDSQLEENEQLLDRIILRRENESRLAHGQRVDRLIDYLKFLENTQEIDTRIKELQSLKKSRTNLAKRLINLIKFRLELNKITTLETPRHKLSVVSKGGLPPIEIDYDEIQDLELFPPEFVREKVTKQIDKRAIIDYLKSGKPLSWARLLTKDTRLSIK